MANTKEDKFRLVTLEDDLTISPGDDVILSCRISPETSAVSMEIRWFIGTDCVLLYKNKNVIENMAYNGRVSLLTKDLQRGNLSLHLKVFRNAEYFTCQVIHGDYKTQTPVWLWYDGERRCFIRPCSWVPSEDERQKMEASVLTLGIQSELMLKARQLDEKNAALEENEKLLRKKTTELEMISKQLEEKSLLLMEKDSELQQTIIHGKERERLLQDKTREVESRKGQLESLENELQDKTKELQELKMHMERELNDIKMRQSKPSTPPDPASEVKRAHSRHRPPDLGGERPRVEPSSTLSELRLVLLSMHSTEKKAAVNTILVSEDLRRSPSTSSQSHHGEVAGRKVMVVDTPDWFNPEQPQGEMRLDVGRCIRLTYPGPHAFLLVIPVDSSEGEMKTVLDKMEDVLGEGCWGHSFLIFTSAEEQKQLQPEDFLKRKSQELQELVKKCGNRCHFLNIKNKNQGAQVTELVEKIENLAAGETERFYSSETYQEAERQLREIERRIQQERKRAEQIEREERDRREILEKNMMESLQKIEGEIQEHEGEIQMLNEKTTKLETKMKEEKDAVKKREMERELQREIAQRELMMMKLSRVKEKREKERREIEERHREEMEAVRERYQREAKVEAEKNLMKVILPELQRNINAVKVNMEKNFQRQIHEKNQEISRLVQEQNEKDELIEKMRALRPIGQKEGEVGIDLQGQQEEDIDQLDLTENERLRRVRMKMSREIERLKQEVNNLSQTHKLLGEVCESSA